ncbi:hypothetical protein FIBSPDRAFT_950279 [Athelia psychrophila]|uniref:Uncharacterized protein n=1 Tax=Athelia psychrophila TaxID=1759441 RepID=A0A166P0T5_9AGAM|nr:hypothetical protein FIBSPDRAFT_950279 [Fibularhizoctonia sp. CBS 109695]
MPLPGQVSGSPNALSLLKLASEIPPDSFPALRDAATSSVSIIEAITDFTSNVEDWASCAQYIGSAVESIIRALATQDPPE